MSYVITAILFAVGPPFRKGIHSNSKEKLCLPDIRSDIMSSDRTIHDRDLLQLDFDDNGHFVPCAQIRTEVSEREFLCCMFDLFLHLFVQFKDAPDQFRIMLFFVSLGNFLLCMIWEVVFIQNILNEVIMKKVRKWRGDIHSHEKIESDILKNGLTKGGPLSNAHVSILIDESDTFRSSKRKKDYYPKIRLESEESAEPLKLNPVPDHFKKNKRLLEVSRL
jgi:hypothetical protein